MGRLTSKVSAAGGGYGTTPPFVPVRRKSCVALPVFVSRYSVTAPVWPGTTDMLAASWLVSVKSIRSSTRNDVSAPAPGVEFPKGELSIAAWGTVLTV